MKKFFFLIGLISLIMCNVTGRKSQKIAKDKDVIIKFTYITYYRTEYENIEAGFILRLYNPNSYNIYIPYIRGLRTIIVEQKIDEKYQFVDPINYWRDYIESGPFFSPDVFSDTSIVKGMNNYLVKYYPKKDG
jgi:hypothetical protein